MGEGEVLLCLYRGLKDVMVKQNLKFNSASTRTCSQHCNKIELAYLTSVIDHMSQGMTVTFDIIQ